MEVFLSLCLKYGFNFGNEWFWNSPISIFYWGSFQNAHIWTRLGTRTKKSRNMQNKNFKKQKKSYLGAQFYACHLGGKWGNLYSLNFTFSPNFHKLSQFREKYKKQFLKKCLF